MKEYIKIKNNYTFREYLTMLSYIYQCIIKDFNSLKDKLEKELIKNCIEFITVYGLGTTSILSATSIVLTFNTLNYETNQKENINGFANLGDLDFYFYTNWEKKLSTLFQNETDSAMYRLLTFLKETFKGEINLSGDKFLFGTQMYSKKIIITPNDLNSGLFLQMYIKSKNKADIFYYDFVTRRIGIINNDYFLPLSPVMEKKIFDALDTMPVPSRQLPAIFNNMINYHNVNINSNGKVRKFWFSGETHHELDFEDNDSKEQVDHGFFECLQCDTDITLEKNKESINESTKQILTNLKNNKVKLDYGSKIKISNELFYSSITSDKKEIDSFFKDPEILVNCDLTKINFKNADIRGMDLSGMDVKIILNELYEKSIEGANLRGIILAGQTLDGIKADNADLRDTYVSVYIESASISGTKFSNTSPFYLNFALVSEDIIKSMGINLEESLKENIELHLIRKKNGEKREY